LKENQGFSFNSFYASTQHATRWLESVRVIIYNGLPLCEGGDF
jgi:hypothetical protein